MNSVTTPVDAGAWPAPTEVAGRQLLPYRTAFEVALDLAEATDRVRDQLRSWLKVKGLDVDRFDAREPSIGKGKALLYVSTNSASGWQLRERQDDGVTWVSTVSVTRAVSQHLSWVSLDVRALAPRGRAPDPDPPRLVRLLLDALQAHDGDAVLASAPIVIAEPQVDPLLEDVVCSERRRLPTVIAAAPSDVSFELWRDLVTRVTGGLAGLASVYLLNPAAARAFNAGIGSTHGISAGAIRTYLTDVDPAWEEDAVRHRVLGRRRSEDEPGRARRALAVIPRQLAANSMPAQAARGLDLSFRDFAPDRTGVTAGRAGLEALQAEIKDLNELLELAGEIERQQRTTISQLNDELLDVASELEVTQVELAARDDLVRALRRRLMAAQLHANAYTPPEETTELPKSFADLVDRIGELAPLVEFTGAISPCLDLDEQQQNSTWAQTAWSALLALRDYASAKQQQGFEGDFWRWCECPAAGRTISPGKVALSESKTVRNNQRLATMRIFPVPSAVSRGGAMFMAAHIRLGQSSTVAPRLYFHDDTTGSGRVYVGYIGRHLENTKTT